MNFLKAMFGNYSKREVKRVQPICDKVLALEDKYAAMSESELKNQTTILKERLANGETTDDILPEAFATCREAGWRVLGMKHFPVQIFNQLCSTKRTAVEDYPRFQSHFFFQISMYPFSDKIVVCDNGTGVGGVGFFVMLRL